MEAFIIEAMHKHAKSPDGKRTRIWIVVSLVERHALKMLGMRGTKFLQTGPDAMEIARRNDVEEGDRSSYDRSP